jgi:hypothetical protein
MGQQAQSLYDDDDDDDDDDDNDDDDDDDVTCATEHCVFSSIDRTLSVQTSTRVVCKLIHLNILKDKTHLTRLETHLDCNRYRNTDFFSPWLHSPWKTLAASHIGFLSYLDIW